MTANGVFLNETNISIYSATRRIIVIQPALPIYRRSLFSRIAKNFAERFTVYASSQPDLATLNANAIAAPWLRVLKPAQPIFWKLEWQTGVLAIPLKRGDILVLSGQPRTLSNLVLILKAKCLGIKVVWWGHLWSSTSRRWRAAIRFRIMRLVDGILFYTEQEAEEYRTLSNRPVKVPVQGLNNGIETDQIAAHRIPYDFSCRPRDLLFMGRLTPKADLGLLLEALRRDNCASVTLDVVGDGVEAEALRIRSARLGLLHRIVWHGAVTDEAKIAKIANRNRLFVYPGSVGLSLIHGLAYGLPAIVHDDRWRHMPEIAAHRVEENGLRFQAGDADSLANTVAGLLKQPDRLAEMSAEALATTARTFNTEDMARRFCMMMDSLR